MRISVSTMEQFRKYRDEDLSYFKLLDSITKKEPPTRYMQLGTAFHAVLENPTENIEVTQDDSNNVYESYIIKVDNQDIEFDYKMMQQAIAVMDYSGVFEIGFAKEYTVQNTTVTISGRADQLVGAKVIENKTAWTTYDYDKYANSCQWQFYMDMFEVVAVVYNVFCMNETKSRGIELKSIERIEMHDYPERQSFLMQLLHDFVTLINQQNLQQYFPDK